MAPRHDPRSILITGGSSGIGRALALCYAAPGVRIALTGRNEARLAEAEAACRDRGAEVRTARVDVRDREAMETWIAALDASWSLDLVVANAGISGGTAGGESAAQAQLLIDVNVDGVLNTVHPAVQAMTPRGHGQIAIVSSMAGFHGLPGAPAYSASKAAVRVYGEAMRGHLGQFGISVSVICPGFVESRMTAGNAFPMPFFMDGDRAARIIRRGLARDRARIAFPWQMRALTWILELLPAAWTDRMLAPLPQKR